MRQFYQCALRPTSRNSIRQDSQDSAGFKSDYGCRYCTKCGGHIIVDHPTLGLIDVRLGALRKFPFKPKVHLNYEETVLPMRDGLPKLRDFPSAIGGTGETLPE
jgi:hypothetical protein